MLKKYWEKRDFSKTPEPSGKKKLKAKKTRELTFVVQEHAATRLHFDFRLEAAGVLLSWAVPKGPSLNPSEKRLAVMTEDHPLDYAGFEGIIPSGYGAGEVIVWDNGTYSPLDSDGAPVAELTEAERIIKAGVKKGQFSFRLDGNKLKGVWTLIKLKQKDKDWLLIKHEDKFANANGHPWEDDSVLSGKTLTDLKKGKTAKQSVDAKKKVPKIKLPDFAPPMLATLTTNTFVSKDWLFEPKLDGIRALSYIDNSQVEMLTRRGLSLVHRYPSVASELAQYTASFVVDGEIVAFDNGRPSFEKLQSRSGLSKQRDIEIAERDNPVKYYIFDILYLNGEDLKGLTLKQRKALLHELIRPSEHIELIEELGADGETAFKACSENGLEGIIGKRLVSTYQTNRRSPDWLKIKTTLTDEFIVCGYTQGTGSRKDTFGALILGEYNALGVLVHVCSVGTGFDDKRIKALLKTMKSLQTNICPFGKKPVGVNNPIWLKPVLVCEIKFAERTKDGSLRVPVFLHLREDIEPKDVKPKPVIIPSSIIPSQAPSKKDVANMKKLPKKTLNKNNSKAESSSINDLLSQLDNDEENLQLSIAGNTLNVSHLNKAFWPHYDKHAVITKRDYLRYLTRVSPWLLPHLRDRLLTLIRFPQGIKGPKFFQKHWEDNRPDFVETVRVFTEHEKKDQDFLLCNNLTTLLWLGQIADLELHTSHTRINPLPDGKKLSNIFSGSLQAVDNSLLNYPDFMVFDLDPYLYSGKEKKGDEPELHREGFKETCAVALWVKELLDKVSMKAYVKTSGRTGLHIYVPIKRNIDYDSIRSISQTVGKYILAEHPTKVTMDWSVSKRPGKVFFDHNMNARSKSLASIYSPRVSMEAAVSTPVEWDELDKIYPVDFTIETLPQRLSEVGDLWADILENKNDLNDLLHASVLPSQKLEVKNSSTPKTKSNRKKP